MRLYPWGPTNLESCAGALLLAGIEQKLPGELRRLELPGGDDLSSLYFPDLNSIGNVAVLVDVLRAGYPFIINVLVVSNQLQRAGQVTGSNYLAGRVGYIPQGVPDGRAIVLTGFFNGQGDEHHCIKGLSDKGVGGQLSELFLIETLKGALGVAVGRARGRPEGALELLRPQTVEHVLALGPVDEHELVGELAFQGLSQVDPGTFGVANSYQHVRV